MNGKKFLFFILCLVLGIYLINSSFEFYVLPKYITNFDNVLKIVSGVLIIIGGLSILSNKKKNAVDFKELAKQFS
jgi:cytochrome c biogenesis protein CcdA|tara:strand:+ start:477 stop:701 length:225 start_codon:yes stop_codon:yes gene_type:complete